MKVRVEEWTVPNLTLCGRLVRKSLMQALVEGGGVGQTRMLRMMQLNPEL